MSANTKRYDALDGIRALACVGIVLIHVMTNGKFGVTGFFFDKMVPSFANFVFLFMTVSGFGICCGYYERIKNKQMDIADFYKKRYMKIWPFFAALCLLDFVMSPSLNSLYEVFANLTLCFGLIPNAHIKVIGVGWFLGTVFVFYIMFPFMVFLLSDKKRAWFSFIVSILMNYVSGTYFDTDRTSIAYSFMFFMAGGMVYIYREQLEKIKHGSILFALALLVVTVVYFAVYSGPIVMLVFGIFALLYGMSVGEKNVFNASALRFLGGISFEVYLCHMIIFRVVEKAHLLRLTGNDYMNYFISFCLVLVGAIIFAFIGKKIIDKLMGIIKEK
ncbi:Peptidoglycan/LPS O-acetylase OafA/YrhL, contains acyltransferase and SGNH-hydrolase domains [Pseudobutyrivibrio sp. YE44]|uniref:acyltransferase family protein n=1 Tax=Pseudobutyrivibrio sp. YE44 TaxID=1520802 RepID=UPI00087F2A8A|nr:acyltransferase [Pseudobutyrivibrio sp. YE44]SDB46961.1 Peptidoglycan/LPS O-acetylase OafA/YrhL, contains acyltransferase and SGNH-hydrolase domains [Pseudobutyrivibrio sp. YE44]